MSLNNTIAFFYLKDTLKSQAIFVSCFSAVIIGFDVYSYIEFWGIPSSFDAFLSQFEFHSFLRIQAFVLVAALLAVINSVISYFIRKDCYIELTETVLYGKLPAFPCRTKEVEIPYKEIIGIKRAFVSKHGTFAALIVKTEKGRIFIPHNSNTKIRKIENLLYELKGN